MTASTFDAQVWGEHKDMVQRTVVNLVDDIDGGSADETIAFSLQGQSYEIDLSQANARKMLKAMETYTSHARKSGRGRVGARRATSSGAGREQLAAMRQWARENGYAVSDRGRVSLEIQNAYHSAR